MALEQRAYGNWSEQDSATGDERQIANGLGWFSIGLGLAEVLAPDSVARLIGVDEESNRSLLRFYGMRELAAGVGILTQPQPTGWLWARVAGDLLDLASLGSALNSEGNDRGKLTTATAAVLGVTALDVMCAQRMQSSAAQNGHSSGNVQVSHTAFVNRPPDEVYAFWRDFRNLPRFMKHIESVQDLGNGRSHWRANTIAGKTVEWDAEMVQDQPGSVIAWRSTESADVDNSGTVRFERAPGRRGTYIKVQLEYAPPAGMVGAAIAKLFGSEPGQQVQEELRAFKSIMEAGEVVKSDSSIHSGMHAAQPPAPGEEIQR